MLAWYLLTWHQIENGNIIVSIDSIHACCYSKNIYRLLHFILILWVSVANYTFKFNWMQLSAINVLLHNYILIYHTSYQIFTTAYFNGQITWQLRVGTRNKFRIEHIMINSPLFILVIAHLGEGNVRFVSKFFNNKTE